MPLCVDLDGTLINSDLLLETVLLLLKQNPLYLVLFPLWLLKGKAAFKAEIAKRVTLDAADLPYNKDFLAWLLEQKQLGRPLWLCTASNHRLAEAVANHLQIFHRTVASSDSENLSGRAKAAQLVTLLGEKGFEYCGNAAVDLKVWAVSHGAVVVNGDSALRKKAERVTDVRASFPTQSNTLLMLARAMRLHQWVKNILVFVPLVAAHQLHNIAAIQNAVLAFFAFCLCASSVYLLNDMLDLQADRQHPTKCRRPFAAGHISLLVGMIAAPLLLLAGFGLGAALPSAFDLMLAIYYLTTLTYSFYIKRLVLLDTINLAALYTVRIVAGAYAIEVPLSFWLLLFSVFLFFSLALVKRYTELEMMQREGLLAARGRGYHIDDLPLLVSFGVAAGYLCVLVLALYINSPAVSELYRNPKVIWLLCVLLFYWISRVWLKAHRGEMHDDPVVFAVKDRTSQLLAVLAMLAVFLAI